MEMRLTKKAEPPPTRGANRANGGWLRRLVRLTVYLDKISHVLPQSN